MVRRLQSPDNAAILLVGGICMDYAIWNGGTPIRQGFRDGLDQITTKKTSRVFPTSTLLANISFFDPVSHTVDAHIMPGQLGLSDLTSDETQRATMILSWDQAA